MKLRHFLLATIIASATIAGYSQTKKSTRSMHDRIHSEQLANVERRMDPTVISDLIKEDVAKRENSVVASVSKETGRLLSDLLAEAHKHIGKPYRHGMKGPRAFDCSGFSSYVYKQFGYTISPSSRAQFTQGTKIDRKSLRQGDLVFFTSRSSGGNVGHVGIVVSADNNTGDFKFIHASIRGVKVSNCEGYYEGRYLGARRIIND